MRRATLTLEGHIQNCCLLIFKIDIYFYSFLEFKNVVLYRLHCDTHFVKLHYRCHLFCRSQFTLVGFPSVICAILYFQIVCFFCKQLMIIYLSVLLSLVTNCCLKVIKVVALEECYTALCIRLDVATYVRL